MCIDERTSIWTFLLGTGVNYWFLLRSRNKSVFGLGALWQFILLVQLCEALIWRSHRTQNEQLCCLASKGAMLLTVLQPVAGLMLALYAASSDSKLAIAIVAITLSFAYLMVMRRMLSEAPRCVKPSKACGGHLAHEWWTKNFPRIAQVLYVVMIVSSFVMFQPRWLSASTALFLGVTAALSKYIYPCAFPTMWCWFAAFAPLYTAATATLWL
jgi:hypothetical protein